MGKAGHEPTVTVIGVCGTLRSDGWFDGGYEVRLVEVPQALAADLADRLCGGPLVYLAPFTVGHWLIRQQVPYGWTVWIRARTPEEAHDAVDDLEWLVKWGDAFPEDQIPAGCPVTARLRCGELADIEPWEQPVDPGPIEVA